MKNKVEKNNLIAMADYCKSVRDGTHDSPKSVDEGKYLITSKHINNNEIYFDNAYKISTNDFNKINLRSKVEKWDVLMSMIGTVGRLYLVKDNPDYAIKNLALFKIGDEYRARYLYYYLSLKEVQDYFEAVANGTSQHFVGLGYLRKFKIKNWDQKSLSTINVLMKYDSLIENNNRRIKILETMAEELYKEWITKYSKEIKITPLNDLLEENFNGGWGKDEPEGKYLNEGYVIRGTDIQDILNSDYSNIPYRYHSNNDINNKQLKENDIIIEMSNGNINNIGRALLITKNILNKFGNVMSASFCKTLRFKNDKDAISTLLLINYLQISGKMMFYKNTGTNGINNFNFKRFLKQKVYLLDENFLLKIKNILDELNLIRKKNEILIQQHDYLLPRLMSGKLSVENKSII